MTEKTRQRRVLYFRGAVNHFPAFLPVAKLQPAFFPQTIVM